MGKRSKQKVDARRQTGGDSGQADYWREKVPRLVSQGRTDEALAAVDRFWPASNPAERFSTLLRTWPLRLASELPATLSPDMAEALAPAPLILEDDAFDALLAAPGAGALAAELRALRVAIAHLGDGALAEARDALQAVGVRSPLRNARMVVRALCSIQDGDDDDARRALSTLRGTPFARVAARIEGGIDGTAPDVSARLGLVAGGARPLDDALRLLRERKPNEALVAISKVATNLTQPVLRLIRRDLPGALLARGVEIEAIPGRMDRALRPDPDDPDDVRLRAVLTEAGGCPCCVPRRWIELLDVVRKRRPPRGLDGRMFEAAILTRAASRLLREAMSGAMDDPFSAFDDLRFDDMETAREWLEKAIQLDPTRRGAWDLLRLLLLELGDKPALNRFAEDLAATFPEDPDALLTAARMCADRRSFTKAADHARRAALLAPHDPRIRDLEAEILIGRAEKQAAGLRPLDGRKSALAACNIVGLGDATRCRARAIAGVFELVAGTTTAWEALREKELATGTSPWEWELRERLAANDLRYDIASKRPAVDLSTLPPPSAADIGRTLRVVAEANANGRVQGELVLLIRHVAPLGAVLTDRRELHLAIHYCMEDADKLPVAERAAELHPDDPTFQTTRCKLAIRVGRPAAYFTEAEATLRRLLYAEMDRGADDDEWLAYHVDQEMVALLQKTLRAVRKHMKTQGAGGAKPAARPRKTSRSKK